MQYRTLGATGEEKSILGFGCMRLPQTDPSDPESIDMDLATQMIRQAIDAGVNYVDTAYTYHGRGGRFGAGKSEPAVGRILQGGYREKVSLATKLPVWLVEKHEDMDRLLDEQLKRLQTDHIDYYLMHNLNAGSWEPIKQNGVFDFMDRIRRDGRVRHIGFSFHDRYELFEEIVQAYDWEFTQIQYNYLDVDYQAGRKGLKLAADKGLGLVVMEPLRGGFLINHLPENIIADLKKIRPGWSLTDWALRWLWNQPEVNVVLSGMSALEHVEENLTIAEKAAPMSEEDVKALDAARQYFLERLKVNCTNCGYCLPCPEGVNIPKCFSHYNNYYLMDSAEVRNRAVYYYGAQLTRAEMAVQCVGCGQCEDKCPQHLPISSLMKDVAALFHKNEN